MPRCALGPSRCSYHFPECIEDNINLSHEVQIDPQGVLLSQARRDLGWVGTLDYSYHSCVCIRQQHELVA